MIGIIGAMRVEVEGLCSLIQNCNVKTINNRVFYTGIINKTDVVVVECGVGKVNAAITTSIMCENFDVDLIINTGVAGGIGNVKPLDIIIGDKFLYHDFDLSPLGYEKGVIPSYGKMFETDESIRNILVEVAEKKHISYAVGNIATGDIFATDTRIIDGLNVDVKAVEMEGAAIAHCAKIYKKPFAAIRVISDVLGQQNQAVNFNELEKTAAKNAIVFVFEIIKKLVLTK